MFYELIGVFVAGAVAALLFWALNRTLKGILPSWLMPVCAGAAMLAATISGEYGWFSRTTANLPEGIEVAQTVEETVFYRPWTYVKPFVTRFVAVDRATMKTHPASPEQRMVDLLFYGRWSPLIKAPVLFDCAAGRRADLIDGVEFSSDGQVSDPDWIAVGTTDPILQTACRKV
ncbi:hypothetical protein [Litoreibacter roseus]|uniref:Uncharacterized protein n=1 Tax=Litoreibacter roseus TaxID=2601869 RepID=A0A6N6J9I4_9RHOB|nr:hypothetical protein [Litoreibacter roseus]GFE62931.1 hypothetical protein KIN_00050 [Litoreibacter roseus]